ncbi:MAG: DUF1761 domain-containing protein [Alphaproteobacteria bacterium]|nr:DUF1761 domain-containing protein [Alphaproteobacteria bacterium]
MSKTYEGTMVLFSSINYLGVFGAAIVGMVIGFLWYSNLLFAKKWMELSKINPKQLEDSSMAVAAGTGFVVTLTLSFCLALVYHYFGSVEDAFMALEFIIFFVAVESAGALIWEKIPVTLYLIQIGHKAVSWVAILLTYVAITNVTS